MEWIDFVQKHFPGLQSVQGIFFFFQVYCSVLFHKPSEAFRRAGGLSKHLKT